MDSGVAHDRGTPSAPRSQSRGEEVGSVAFSPDGRLVAGGELDGDVLLWATDGWARAPLAAVAPRSGEAPSVAFSPDGRTLATSDRDRAVVLWDELALRIESAVLAQSEGVIGHARRGQEEDEDAAVLLDAVKVLADPEAGERPRIEDSGANPLPDCLLPWRPRCDRRRDVGPA